MKMDSSLSKSSSVNTSGASSNRSSGVGTMGAPSSLGFREAAHFANIMVEFEDSTREMAVDVPESFIAQTKTPPKYPPPSSASNSNRNSLQNGNHYHGSPPPMLSSRDHLRIEPDGHFLNMMDPPSVPSKSSGSTPPPAMPMVQLQQVPTPQQSQRMKRYGEEIAKRNAQMERKERTDQFLRQSIRNSQKIQALKERHGGAHGTMANGGLDAADGAGGRQQGASPAAPVSLSSFLGAVQRLGLSVPGPGASQIVESLGSVAESKDFQNAYKLNQKLQSLSQNRQLTPSSYDAQELTDTVMNILGLVVEDDTSDSPVARELAQILDKATVEGLLYTHDRIAGLKMDSGPQFVLEDDALLRRLGNYSEPNIKIVRIEKTSEPLGATVRNEDEAVVVGRIMRGGTAEASGLLHEGDEVLEVNEVPLRGKNVNEVCDIMAQMQGTLTLLVVPTRQHVASPSNPSSGGDLHNSSSLSSSSPTQHQPVMHVKAHIDYDPEDDLYLPCRELGLSFLKGHVLHVINQKDPHWWQARREGEDDSQLPGLIPSASFQQQRESLKHTVAAQDAGDKYGTGAGGRMKRARTGFLCAKRASSARKNKGGGGSAGGGGGTYPKGGGHHNKGRTGPPFNEHDPERDPDAASTGTSAEDIIIYEEVALYYPRSDRKRPVVLIGPPNIGRHELRQRLMQDGDRFTAAIPHTSRPRRADEVDSQDYHFISRLTFEQDILARKFVEHGEYEKSYYGTSLEAIRSVVTQERICVLNLHPQSLRILKASDLMPFVVFVAPPSLERLRRWKMERSEPVASDDELKEIIERAREMEEAYGHYFDMVIIYSDPERAYQELLREINLLEREPQWVPASWVQNKKASFYK